MGISESWNISIAMCDRNMESFLSFTELLFDEAEDKQNNGRGIYGLYCSLLHSS